MKTIAIDFETANPAPGNACQIGLAWIVGNKVVRVEERLIRPRDLNFTFTWVHGITADDVRDVPEFPEVLAEFRDELSGALMLAHNAPFDAGVMRGCAKAYGLSVQAYRTNNVLRTEVAARDVAELAAELCGPLFAKTTGAQLPVDGGNERVI